MIINGTLLIAGSIVFLRKQQLQTLILTANIHNHSVIAEYPYYHFESTGDSIIDINGDYFKSVYLMTLKKTKSLE